MSFATDELNHLQQAINREQPRDVIQFCANYFDHKLQQQRLHLWSQQQKAEAAGITLFPQVDSAHVPAIPHNKRQPSFKSPFSVNDPHQQDAGDPTSAPAAGLFKSDFNVNSGAPTSKTDPLDPSTATAGGVGARGDADLASAPAQKIPNFNANRRTSVSAETLNPDLFKSSGWTPPKNNQLSAEERQELSQKLGSYFLFDQLDASSKKTVVSALESKSFPKNTEIIRQGDEGDFFYIIVKGTVDFFVNGSKVNSSGEGSYFGELALMYNSPRAATAVAASDVQCWALDRATFRSILLESTYNRRTMYENFLKDVKVLSSLTPQERSKLADALKTEVYHKGDKIVVEGEKGENFYFIEKGACKVYSNDKGELTQLKDGDYFGEIALLNDLPRQATVEAVDTVIVATLGKSGFERLLGPAIQVLRQQDPRQHN
ncbi:hypothetical protein DIURU_001262 [Diutina rugosa]|uniref:cAMP-dependent protein kinase regulatory subunit n=1 Tax=Diutina rugosa TaxID=5481 RepID=A0A642UZY8_DIURU|nr:uncharacterized protein DIURU_001262 [Diutina rugosa]KAA8906079.1 hypothetical protein DIURU_001262 [Diutina rugosa]